MSSSKTYWTMVVLGATNLIPWMTFLSLPDYFADFYSSNKMEYYFPAVSTGALVCTAATLLAVGSKLSFDVRIAYPTAIMMILGLLVPVIDLLVSTGILGLDAAFSVTLLGVLLSAVMSSTAQNSLYALASLLGDSGTAALQAGQGAMGLLSLALRCISKVGFPPTLAMYSFCLSGSLMILGSLLSYYALMSDPSVRPRIDAHERRRSQRAATNPAAAEPMLAAEAGMGGTGGSSGSSSGGGGSGGGGAPSALALLRLTCRESTCVFTTFLVALSIFPGLTTSLVSTMGLGGWYPLLLVGAYNSGDLVGKSAPTLFRLVNRATLPVCATLHCLFVPALLLLSHPQYLPPPLRSDMFAIAVVFKLGCSTGYIGCMALVLGSERATTPEEKEGAGLFTSFALMMGLAAGSSCGLLLEKLA